MQGAVPYKDYSWVLGPLMPYYYSSIFRLFGASIQSALLGQNILILLAGMIIFLTCALLLSPSMSFIAALCYWTVRGTEFFYTYTHIGGLAALLGTILFFMKYLKEPRKKHALYGYLCILLLIFVRLNIGVATLFIFSVFLYVADQLICCQQLALPYDYSRWSDSEQTGARYLRYVDLGSGSCR